MVPATGVRIGWAEVPPHVRRAVERIIGGPVGSAVSQPGGFSPGTALRVRTTTGRRAFVKAVSPAQNAQSVTMHRQEGVVTAALPPQAPAPRLLGSFDDGEWIALVFEDVEGLNPQTPWRADQLDLVVAALDDMATALTPAPIAGLPTAAASLRTDFEGWREIAAAPPASLDPWSAAHLDELIDLACRGAAALDGDTVVHLDVRADNLLVGPAGRVTLVDWPWAAVGPAWLDRLALLINVRMYGGHDTERMLHELAASTGADLADLRGALVGFAGFFMFRGTLPPPPGLPTVRAFQRAQADVLVEWFIRTW